MPNKLNVAVIGGGMAGLAAACHLTKHGINTTLFEAAPQLGGRTRKVNYNGLALDNGQHLMLGAYADTLSLLKLAGTDESAYLQRVPLSLNMQHLQTKQQVTLNACANLPAPLHLLFGFILAKGLSLKSRFCAIQLMVWLKLKHFKLSKDVPLADFLNRLGQDEELIQFLWEPLCLAALNTPVEAASSQVFLNVLRDSFDRRKNDSDLLLPKTDLSTLLVEPLAAYIEANGGKIFTHQAVKALNGTEITVNSEKQQFSHLIIATAPHQLKTLGISDYAFRYQPITTVYLQYSDHVRLPQHMVGLVGGQAQWVFDRGLLCGQKGLLAVIISAHAPFNVPQEALAMQIAVEIKSLYPQCDNLLWHKVITEKRATFSCDASLQRPVAKLSEKVYLAGDYVQGDYPATIEGAVRSGIFAAKQITDNMVINKKEMS